MQQRNHLLKFILDIESMIGELELIMVKNETNYQNFAADFISIRAVERDLMIIGEAVSNILKMNASSQISASNDIIGLRNMIVHAYDAIDPAVLWKILIKDLPLLKQEILALKSS